MDEDDNLNVNKVTNINNTNINNFNVNLNTNFPNMSDQVNINKDDYFIQNFNSSTLKKVNSFKSCCTCTKTNCQKKYCNCFAKGLYCIGCECKDCENHPPEGYLLNNTLNANELLQNSAFKPDGGFLNNLNLTLRHNQSISSNLQISCTCTRSNCSKKYCECYKLKRECTSSCRCVGCVNKAGYKNQTNSTPMNQNCNASFGNSNDVINENNNSVKTNSENNRIHESEKKDYHIHKLCPFAARGIGVSIISNKVDVMERDVLLSCQKAFYNSGRKKGKHYRKRSKIEENKENHQELKNIDRDENELQTTPKYIGKKRKRKNNNKTASTNIKSPRSCEKETANEKKQNKKGKKITEFTKKLIL